MRRPVGMWIRYDDGSIEYAEYTPHRLGFFSKIRKALTKWAKRS